MDITIKGEMKKLYKQSDPWSVASNPYNDKKYKRELNIIKKYKAKSILELGCGEGVLTKMLASVLEKVDAIDISEEAIKRAKDNTSDFKNITYYCSDITKYEIENNYDVILASEILGYVIWFNTLLDVGFFLERVVNSLNSTGIFLIVNTIEQKDAKTGKDKIQYRRWGWEAYYTMLRYMGMTYVYKKRYSGVKNDELRKYEISVFQKK
jgi:2-polyprenyl-3-methyl-5-hydroxy-6-metoxy-1,4-benzoquinol methylase